MTEATHISWECMKKRCLNPNDRSYHNYGGRGISICAEWLLRAQGYRNFVADMGERPDGMTLDRIDNNGNYEPSNCRWATWSQQRLNQRPARLRPRRTACFRGHPFTPENTRIRQGGRHECRTCLRVRRRAAYRLFAPSSPVRDLSERVDGGADQHNAKGPEQVSRSLR